MDQEKHIAIVTMSYRSLAEMLRLPVGMRITGVSEQRDGYGNLYNESVAIRVEGHPDLPVCHQGFPIPHVDLEIKPPEVRVDWPPAKVLR